MFGPIQIKKYFMDTTVNPEIPSWHLNEELLVTAHQINFFAGTDVRTISGRQLLPELVGCQEVSSKCLRVGPREAVAELALGVRVGVERDVGLKGSPPLKCGLSHPDFRKASLSPTNRVRPRLSTYLP